MDVRPQTQPQPRSRRGGLAATLPALLLLALTAGTTGATASAAGDGPPPTLDMVVTSR